MRWEWDGEAFEDCVVFHKAADREGDLAVGKLSNMSGALGMKVNGVAIRSSEALYQSLRFPHRPDWQREILARENPMGAKMMAKKDGRRRLHSRPDWDEIRVDAMRWCLRVKMAQNRREFFTRLLRWTAPRPIVERSLKDRFWGAALEEDGVLRGANRLGRLLAELRDRALSAGDSDPWAWRVEPLPIEDFLLLGEPIGVIEPAREAAPA